MSHVHENDVVRLIRPVGQWPAGTEGAALVVVGSRLSIELPSGSDGFNFIEATEADVEVVWRLGLGDIAPPLRAGEPAS